jgi:thioredoxin 1
VSSKQQERWKRKEKMRTTENTTSSKSQSKVFVVSDQNFTEQVLNSPLPVVVDFWAKWCGHCHNLAPLYQQLSVEYEGRLRFAKLDVEEQPQIPIQYHIQACPTLLFFKDGTECARVVGPTPSRLKRIIDQFA